MLWGWCWCFHVILVILQISFGFFAEEDQPKYDREEPASWSSAGETTPPPPPEVPTQHGNAALAETTINKEASGLFVASHIEMCLPENHCVLRGLQHRALYRTRRCLIASAQEQANMLIHALNGSP
jgi:hypothetical protein